jgi:hypothetical protein
MKYIDEEDRQKLFRIGMIIDRLKRLNKELRECFIRDGQPVYGDAQSTEDIMSVVELYIKGEGSDYIGEQVFQSDGEPVKKLLGMMGVHVNE